MRGCPNVLLIYTDQHRWDALGCAGNPDIRTPHLDGLARGGVRFANHFVQHPLCMPSRISMLSGRYPATLGITHMGVPVPPSEALLTHDLASRGYTCSVAGKLHFLPHACRDHREPHPPYGFHHTEISDEPGTYDDAYRAYIRARMPEQLRYISRVADPPAFKAYRDVLQLEDGFDRPAEWDPWTTKPFPGHDDATHTAFVGQRTIEILAQRAKSGAPFFHMASFYSPHSPLVAPQRFLDLYDADSLRLPSVPDGPAGGHRDAGIPESMRRQAARGYYAMISEVDEQFGRIMGCLRELGIDQETIVVVTSDHGEFLGEFGRFGKGYPAPDCVGRVPLMMSGPGIKQDAVEDALVESVDIVPTLLELIGVPPLPRLQGQPLTPLLRGSSEAGGFVERPALMEDADWKSLRTRRERYILHRDGTESLFDLTAPFGEYHDVAGDPDRCQVLAELRHVLATRLLGLERPLARTWAY